jgi:hypothetical protein
MQHAFSTMKHRSCLFLSAALLAGMLGGCGGIPLSSVPRLVQLNSQMAEANPAEFMVALQVDARLSPPPGAVPLLAIKVTPKDPKAFEAIDKKLPLQVSVTSAATLGLDAPTRGRRWLIYSLPPATQAEMQRIQALIRQAKSSKENAGGTLSLGVEQDSLAAAVTDPSLSRSRWETWLQVKKAEGFFEVWSGTPEDIQKLAAKNR